MARSYHIWRDVAPGAPCSAPRGRTATDHSHDDLDTARRLAEHFQACVRVDGVRYYVRRLDEHHPAYWAGESDDPDAGCWSDVT